MVDNVNGMQRFRILSWLKPTINEEGATSLVFSMHVSLLRPDGPLLKQQNELKFRHEEKGNTLTTVLDFAVDELFQTLKCFC